jgi:hypothetical protein
MKKLVLFLPTLLLLAACNNNKPLSDYGAKFAEIMKSSEGMFRGIEPGRSKKEIAEKEKPAQPKDEDDRYLYYEFPGDTGELYTVEYNFDERGLNEVKLDAYFVNAADARTLFVSFRDYYTAKFGETEKFEGFAAWAFKDASGRTIQLELSDQSAEYRQGKFALDLYYVPEDPGTAPSKK